MKHTKPGGIDLVVLSAQSAEAGNGRPEAASPLQLAALLLRGLRQSGESAGVPDRLARMGLDQPL